MGALDKLNKKASELSGTGTKQESEKVDKKAVSIGNAKKTDIKTETKTKKNSANVNKAVTKNVNMLPASTEAKGKSASVKGTTSKKVTDKKETGSGKHPGGRPRKEGTYKKVNLSVPEEVYNRLKEVSGGNMTYYINSMLREKVGL